MVVVVLSFMLQPDPPKPELAYARSLAPQAASTEPSNAWLKPQVQNDSVAEPVTPPQATASKSAQVSDEATAPQVANASKATSVPSAPAASAPASVAAPAATATNVPAPVVAVPEPKPQFRLNGIIYTPTLPSAIVNGAIVHVGDSVDGATILSITPKRVNLQINGQRKALDLR
jgi:cytoskeletal protein RodZ